MVLSIEVLAFLVFDDYKMKNLYGISGAQT